MTVYDYALQHWLTGAAGAHEAAKQAHEILSMSNDELDRLAAFEGVPAYHLRQSNARKMRQAERELGIITPGF